MNEIEPIGSRQKRLGIGKDINERGSWDWDGNKLQRNLGLEDLGLGINESQDENKGSYIGSQSDWKDWGKEQMFFENHCIERE